MTDTWRTLLRLLTLQPVEIHRLASGDRWIAALAAIALALWLGFNRWEAGANAQWYGAGVAGLAWYALFLLALAWLLARLTPPGLPYRSVLLAVTAFLPAALVIYIAATRWGAPQLEYAADFLLLLLGLIYLDRTLRRLGGARPRRALFVALILAVSFGWLTRSTWIASGLWYEADDSADYQASWDEQERLLFAQPDRVDTQVGRVHAGDPATSDVFFVGFAGYAEERVFAEEVKLAASVVGARHGSAERSVLLVNDRRDLESKPMATVSGLRRALAGVAGRMDVNQDILFLVLSSHGAADPSLSVSNGVLPLDQLTGTSLREALDESGIRWRVIVISACYAGAFIEPIKDDNTIILTASAADRTSFGCSDTRDLTYFGEAFFRDALPKAPTLRDAFDSAREAIEARETSEKQTPSRPQAYFGKAMERHWAAFESKPAR